MVDPGHDDSTIQRGFDEAHACQDMLARVPPKPSPRSRMTPWLAAMSTWFAARRLAARPEATPLPVDHTVTR
jgi:hypothetical protein